MDDTGGGNTDEPAEARMGDGGLGSVGGNGDFKIIGAGTGTAVGVGVEVGAGRASDLGSSTRSNDPGLRISGQGLSAESTSPATSS